MKFGAIAIAAAQGCVAAHGMRAGDLVIRKGAIITAADIARLSEAGVGELVVVRFEQGDVDENAAATRIAAALLGQGVTMENAFTGRVNLFAETAGVLRPDVAAIDALNRVDEAITVATLPAMKAVVAGEMIATVKIIPYGLHETLLETALATLSDTAPIKIAAYRPLSVGMISTLLPGLKASVIDKTLRVMAKRLAPAGALLSAELRVPHQSGPLARALATMAAGPDIIVIFGASAISDRRDVIPQALLEAGGRIEHLGMPVDPGNLLLIGELAGKPVIAAPGCARSPKENGFDWVLQRSLAGISVRRADIQALGVGGLLMEIVSRPQPRMSVAE